MEGELQISTAYRLYQIIHICNTLLTKVLEYFEKNPPMWHAVQFKSCDPDLIFVLWYEAAHFN